MLTNEKVLNIFKEYLAQDPAYEVVSTSRGYAVMAWDQCREEWYDVRPCATPEALRDTLLDAYVNFLEYSMTSEERDLTVEERNKIQTERLAMMERCRKEEMI